MNHQLEKLEVLDLGYNQIIDVKAVECFARIESLYLLNLVGNPLESAKEESKKELTEVFKGMKEFTYPEVYVRGGLCRCCRSMQGLRILRSSWRRRRRGGRAGRRQGTGRPYDFIIVMM